jgi:hypothetical protein
LPTRASAFTGGLFAGAAAAIGFGGAGDAFGADASGAAVNVCMQIRHSTGVPASMSMPKFSVEPQCGQDSCVDGMGGSR